MRDRDFRPDGRPWTLVRSTEELREAADRAWTIDQIEIDTDAIRAEGYEAGRADGAAGRAMPEATADEGVSDGAKESAGNGWASVVAKLQRSEASE